MITAPLLNLIRESGESILVLNGGLEDLVRPSCSVWKPMSC